MKISVILMFTFFSGFAIAQSESRIDTLPSGELMLTQIIIINASHGTLWKAYTEADEWKKWVTPVAEIDFKINGTVKSHYDPTRQIGDKGTIVIHILNYIPFKQITMQAELNENFPEFMRGEKKSHYSIVNFEKISDVETKVTLYGIGYKNEKQWLDLLPLFIQGNEMTLNNLKEYAETKESNMKDKLSIDTSNSKVTGIGGIFFFF